MKARFSASLVVGTLAAMLLAGCQDRDPIAHYTVPKQQPTAPAAALNGAADGSDRMLAAIVPQGEDAWFFKVAGPTDAVAAEAETFRAFIKSLKFDAKDGQPKWTVPAGWQQQPGSGMRYATLVIGAPDQPLDLSVIKLPMLAGDEAAYNLDNINRWRGQLSLPPIGIDQLATQTETITLGDTSATLVNIAGKLSSGGMGSAPFASGLPPGADPIAPFASGLPAAGSPAGNLTYDTPEGWTPGTGSSLSKAAFAVTDGGRVVEVTVTDLAAAAGSLLPNVNRWRQQIGLPEIDQKQLDREVEEIQLGGVAGSYVEMFAPGDAADREAILGVIAIHGGQAWFIKLKGNAELAEREKARFKAFVQSIKFGI